MMHSQSVIPRLQALSIYNPIHVAIPSNSMSAAMVLDSDRSALTSGRFEVLNCLTINSNVLSMRLACCCPSAPVVSGVAYCVAEFNRAVCESVAETDASMTEASLVVRSMLAGTG